MSLGWFYCGSFILVKLDFRVFVFVRGKLEKPEKNPRSNTRTNNKLNPHVEPGRNWTQSTLVEGDRFHYCHHRGSSIPKALKRTKDFTERYFKRVLFLLNGTLVQTVFFFLCRSCISRHLMNNKECFFCKKIVSELEEITSEAGAGSEPWTVEIANSVCLLLIT